MTLPQGRCRVKNVFVRRFWWPSVGPYRNCLSSSSVSALHPKLAQSDKFAELPVRSSTVVFDPEQTDQKRNASIPGPRISDLAECNEGVLTTRGKGKDFGFIHGRKLPYLLALFERSGQLGAGGLACQRSLRGAGSGPID